MVDTKTTAETLRSTLDGTELIRLATPGANWKTPAVGVLGGRIRLTTTTNFYVSPAGNDSNDGLTALTPWLTLQHAVDTIIQNYYVEALDTIAVGIAINLADGTYTSQSGVVLPPFGDIGNPQIGIFGNAVNPQNVVLNVVDSGGGPGAVLYAWGPSEYYISGLSIDASTDVQAATNLCQVQRGSAQIHLVLVRLGKAGNAGLGNHCAVFADVGATSMYLDVIEIYGTAQSYAFINGEHSESALWQNRKGSLTLTVDPLWPAGCLNISGGGRAIFSPQSIVGVSSGTKAIVKPGCMLEVSTVAAIPGTGITNDGLIISGSGGFDYQTGVGFGLGKATVDTGKVLLRGVTSGIVTLSTQDAAGTWTGKLPTTAGTANFFLQTDGGSPANLTWADGGLPSAPVNSVQYDNAGVFGGAANFFITSGNPNVTAGNAYLYAGSNVITADPPNNNFHFAGGGNLTMSGTFNYTLGANAGLALTTGANNFVFGRDAGKALTTGASNVLIGRNAGTALTTSLQNVAVGQNTLSVSTTLATQCVAIGFDAMQNAVGGQHNVGVGPGALNSISGSDNVGLGYQALASALSGANNLGMGASALLACTTGNANCAVGASALGAITTGSNNMGIGTQALGTSALGDANIAIGFQSLFFAGTITGNVGIGYQAGSHQATGDYNIYIGYQSGQSGTTSSGSYGVGVGWQTLYSVTSGTANTACGAGSGNQITTGDRNVIFGSSNCSTTLTTGSRNIVVGDQIEVASNSASNTLNIGNYIFGTGMDGLSTTISAGKIGIGVKAPAFNFDVAGSLGQKEAAFLMHTSIALTAGSTANAPTLTTGPVTGNPTKWIALDDNGTTRYIPSW